VVAEPRWEEQRRDQAAIAGDVEALATGTVPGSDEPAPPSNEVKAQLRTAAAAATAAAEDLAARRAAPANEDQNEVIRILDAVRAELETAVFNAFPPLLEDLGEQWIAYLEQMILTQKIVIQHTAAIEAQRRPDGGFARAQLIGLTATAKGQLKIIKLMDTMEHWMELSISAHVPVTWPPIVPLLIDLVRRDAPIIAERLAKGRDPGPETQAMEAAVLEWLQAMYDSMSAGAGDDTTPPPDWAGNGFGLVPAGSTDLSAEIRMLITIQAALNQRTAALDERARDGDDPAALARGYAEVARLQVEVHKSIQAMTVGGMPRWRPDTGLLKARREKR
jgi:hypothetical protein